MPGARFTRISAMIDQCNFSTHLSATMIDQCNFSTHLSATWTGNHRNASDTYIGLQLISYMDRKPQERLRYIYRPTTICYALLLATIIMVGGPDTVRYAVLCR